MLRIRPFTCEKGATPRKRSSGVMASVSMKLSSSNSTLRWLRAMRLGRPVDPDENWYMSGAPGSMSTRKSASDADPSAAGRSSTR